MAIAQLDNLVSVGKLKADPPAAAELEGLLASGSARLTDAQNEQLTFESRFDLAYNAAHSLALAALRFHGYRSENRYIVFQVLPHTVGLRRNGACSTTRMANGIAPSTRGTSTRIYNC